MRQDSLHPNSRTASGEWAPFSGEGPLTRNGQAGALAHLVEAFAAAWERGERPSAEAFLDRHPRLTLEPEAAIRLIYEEVCIRKGEGQEVRLSELVRRFPRWQNELEVLLDCDRLIGAVSDPPAFPAAGETLGDFVLLAELGRGARQQFRNDIRLRSSLCRRSLWLAEVLDDRANSHSRANLTSVACTGV